MPRYTYTLSAYAPEAYVFSIPLRASTAWLRRTLRREDIINGEPLRKNQFEALKKRVHALIELGWYEHLSYYVEGYPAGDRIRKKT
jgi:hypothetical protein